jgi:hypothetical protein
LIWDVETDCAFADWWRNAVLIKRKMQDLRKTFPAAEFIEALKLVPGHTK